MRVQSLCWQIAPANGQPLWKLKTIIITAFNMRGSIPAKLPVVENLVIVAESCVELSFEDPVATSSALKKLCIFGMPLTTDGTDMLRMSDSLRGRGLTLGPVAAPDGGRQFLRDSAYIYLRALSAKNLSIQELYTMGNQLTGIRGYCRCGACMLCLRRAGCLD